MTEPLIRHAHFEDMVQDLRRAFDVARSGQIIWLTGPSGTGKSEGVIATLRDVCGPQSLWAKGCIPAVRVRATLSDRNKFNPKDLALRLCVALADPAPEWLKPRESVSGPDASHDWIEAVAQSEQWTRSRAGSTEHGLRLGFERGAKVRKLRWIAVEEAASLLKVHLHQRSEHYMTGLMQLAEETRCVLLMVGTADAADLWFANREVRNRSIWVWSRPYRHDVEVEQRKFAELLKALSKRYPLRSPDLLVKKLELLFLNGGGVFGTTVNFLERANSLRLHRGDERIEVSHLVDASSTQEDQANLMLERAQFDELCYPDRNVSFPSALKKAAGRRQRT